MIPIITAAIAPQNFEVVRDQIALVLATELANQYVLDPTAPNVNKVWVDRFIPIDSATECPTVIVGLHKGDWSNETTTKATGTYIFNIDIYTNANTDDTTGPGDQYAVQIMNKIAGMLRAILTYPDYDNLGFTDGFTLDETSVIKYQVAFRGEVEDMLSTVVGRLQFMVKCIEVTPLPDNSVPINDLTTTIKLNNSEFGYFYETINVTALTP